MPKIIHFEHLPHGITLEAALAGQKVPLIARDFFSSEDGDSLIMMLEGFPSIVLNMLNNPYPPSVVDHLLVILRRDKSATVYLNELIFAAEIVSKKNKTIVGEHIYSDDIADIRTIKIYVEKNNTQNQLKQIRFLTPKAIKNLELEELEVPKDAGVFLVFSDGWRKGVYFDFRPLHDEAIPVEYEFNVLLAQLKSYLSFQHLHKISEKAWRNLFKQKWFPFITLKKDLLELMLHQAKVNRSIDKLLKKVSENVVEVLPKLLERWRKNPLFNNHFPLLDRAVERYLAKDYHSCVSILYPRIEGILRENLKILDSKSKFTQGRLSKSLISNVPVERQEYSVLLPQKFEEFLTQVYFENFDPITPKTVSRHSISHGVAPHEKFNLKSATIALLIIDQLYFYLFPHGEKST